MIDGHIEFIFNEVSKPSFFRVKKYKEWISKNLEDHPVKKVSLIYIYSNDPYVLSINQQFLKHDDYTDIITFDNTINEKHLQGEIYISLDRVKENAKQFKTTYQKELQRVIAHGILHLLGYKDKSPKDEQIMRNQEETWISKF
jgi:probable rRNA maturation factor